MSITTHASFALIRCINFDIATKDITYCNELYLFPLSFQDIVINKFHKAKRGELASFPSIVVTGAETLHHCPKDVTDISIVTSIPSESDCTSMLKSLVEGKFSAVSCSLGTYTQSSLQTLLKIHALRDISKSVREEIKWLYSTTSAPNKECVSPSFLDDYKKLLLEDRDGSLVVNDTILTSDLMKLTGNKWLNLALVQGFVDLRNAYHSETAIFVLNDLLLFNEEKLQKESHFYGKQLRFITFIINVGGNIKETFLATPKKPGLHWTLLYVDTTQNKWFYCDTLGWAFPSDLTSTVNDTLKALSIELPFAIKPVQGRFLAHKPQSMSRGSRQCKNTCFQNIPLQKCGNVCGVIVIVMAAISCISPTLWRLGFLDVKKHPFVPDILVEGSNVPFFLLEKGCHSLAYQQGRGFETPWNNVLTAIGI